MKTQHGFFKKAISMGTVVTLLAGVQSAAVSTSVKAAEREEEAAVLQDILLEVASAGGNGNAAGQDAAEDGKTGLSSSGTEKQTDSVTGEAAEKETADRNQKEETVYVITDAYGAPDEIIVSDWLKNIEGSDTLRDASTLKDIENLKGDETFSKGSGDSLRWEANGNDIYYQGYAEEELPVSVAVSYYLDGKKTEPKDLAGKSGRVKIRFDYTNHTAHTVVLDDEEEIEICTPFLMISGAMLDTERFSNVSITNGRVVSNANTLLVVGYALPGLKDSLALDEEKLDDTLEELEINRKDVEIPEYVEIEADTIDFQLSMTMTMASSDALSSMGLSDIGNIDKIKEIQEDMDELADGAEELSDGTDKLYDGVVKLSDGTNKLYDGTTELHDGVKELRDGTDELHDGTKELYDGTVDLADGAGKLRDGAGTLASGTGGLADGAGKLADGTGRLRSGVSTLKDGTGTLVTGAGTLSSGVKQYTEGVAQLSDGLSALNSQVGTLDALPDGIAQLLAGESQMIEEIKNSTTATAQVLSMLQQNKSEHASWYTMVSSLQGGNGAGDLSQLSGAMSQLNQLYDGILQMVDNVALAETVTTPASGAAVRSAAATVLRSRARMRAAVADDEALLEGELSDEELLVLMEELSDEELENLSGEELPEEEEVEQKPEAEEKPSAKEEKPQQNQSGTPVEKTDTGDRQGNPAGTGNTTQEAGAGDHKEGNSAQERSGADETETQGSGRPEETQTQEGSGTGDSSARAQKPQESGSADRTGEAAGGASGTGQTAAGDSGQQEQTAQDSGQQEQDGGSPETDNEVQESDAGAQESSAESPAEAVTDEADQAISGDDTETPSPQARTILKGSFYLFAGDDASAGQVAEIRGYINRFNSAAGTLSGMDVTGRAQAAGAAIQDAATKGGTVRAKGASATAEEIRAFFSAYQSAYAAYAETLLLAQRAASAAAEAGAALAVLETTEKLLSQTASSVGEIVTGMQQLQAGTSTLANAVTKEKIGALTGGVSQLAAGAGTLKDKNTELTGGMTQLTSGIGELDKGAATLKSGVEELDGGVSDLNSGARKLRDGADELYGGTKDLADGTIELRDGAGELHDGVTELKDGVGELYDGTDELQDGAKKLQDGVKELKDGALELRDGMIEFNEEGIQKLTDAFDLDIASFANRLQAVGDAGEAYTSFSGLDESMDGSVKFIYRTGAVE